MPNRKTQFGEAYRYAFQGQEIDPETGKEAFQLRLWDSRIGRWLTTDPYGQYSSPYIGMGNNPISMADPDGGFTCYRNGEPVECANPIDELAHGGENPVLGDITYLNEITITVRRPGSWGSDAYISDKLDRLHEFRMGRAEMAKPFAAAAIDLTLMFATAGFSTVGMVNFGKEGFRRYIGPNLSKKSINFMQNSTNNARRYHDYKVLDNAESLSKGSLNSDILRVSVWRDKAGKIWTHDHGRLAAFRLSKLDNIPVKWATQEKIIMDAWKMSTKVHGKSIKLKLGGGESIIVK